MASCGVKHVRFAQNMNHDRIPELSMRYPLIHMKVW
jgi:hypothetical protein